MKFKRGLDPQKSMEIGLSNDLIHPERIIVKFTVNNDEEDINSISCTDFARFLEMWRDGFESDQLKKILHFEMYNLRRIWKPLKKRIKVFGVNIKADVTAGLDPGEINIHGNIAECLMGDEKEIFVTWMGKIYTLPVKSCSRYWVI